MRPQVASIYVGAARRGGVFRFSGAEGVASYKGGAKAIQKANKGRMMKVENIFAKQYRNEKEFDDAFTNWIYEVGREMKKRGEPFDKSHDGMINPKKVSKIIWAYNALRDITVGEEVEIKCEPIDTVLNSGYITITDKHIVFTSPRKLYEVMCEVPIFDSFARTDGFTIMEFAINNVIMDFEEAADYEIV